MSERVDITWHEGEVSRAEREALNGHRGRVVWFTGLSGSGKSTIANRVDRHLWERKMHSVLLDGDNVRHGLNAPPSLLMEGYGAEFAQRFGLGFDRLDREENIRRIGAVAQLFAAAGVVTLTSFVSPYRRDRAAVRQLVTSHGRPDDFVEIFVNTPLAICEARDPKGLYRRARGGEITNFTGIDDPYEPPLNAELVLETTEATVDQLARIVVDYLVLPSQPRSC